MSAKIKRWNLLLIISAVIGLAYAIYLISYIANTMGQQDSSASKAGAAIAFTLMIPHLIILIAAVILNIVAIFTNSPVVALITAIFYSVSALFFLLYIFFVTPSIVLSWIGFTQLRKRKQLMIQQPATQNLVPPPPATI